MKAASDGGENIPVHLSVRELERLEKKNWKKKKKKTKCGKGLGRFPRTGASSRGRTVSAVWYVVHTCSSPVQFAAFKAPYNASSGFLMYYGIQSPPSLHSDHIYDHIYIILYIPEYVTNGKCCSLR